MWLAPLYELNWGPFVFHWDDYSREKEYKGTYMEHECPAPILQHRINELENAIRIHQDKVGKLHAVDLDHQLWKVLDGGS